MKSIVEDMKQKTENKKYAHDILLELFPIKKIHIDLLRFEIKDIESKDIGDEYLSEILMLSFKEVLGYDIINGLNCDLLYALSMEEIDKEYKFPIKTITLAAYYWYRTLENVENMGLCRMELERLGVFEKSVTHNITNGYWGL